MGGAASLQAPDLEDVKDSVRQGVSKVAGRLSNVASGVMTQLQVNLMPAYKESRSPSTRFYCCSVAELRSNITLLRGCHANTKN